MKFWSLEQVKQRELMKQVQLEAYAESQVYDAEGIEQLPFEETNIIPKQNLKREKVPLSAGVYNLVRGILNECRP